MERQVLVNAAGCDSCVPGATGAELKWSEKVCGGRLEYMILTWSIHASLWLVTVRSKGVGESRRWLDSKLKVEICVRFQNSGFLATRDYFEIKGAHAVLALIWISLGNTLFFSCRCSCKLCSSLFLTKCCCFCQKHEAHHILCIRRFLSKKKTMDSIMSLWKKDIYWFEYLMSLHTSKSFPFEVFTIWSMLKLFSVLTPSLPYLEPSRVSS